MFQDAKLDDQGVGMRVVRSELEVIYSAHTKSKRGFMDFETFISSLPNVAARIFPNTAKREAIESLIRKCLSTNTKSNDINIKIAYEEDTKLLLTSIMNILKDVYDVYFGDPFKTVKNSKLFYKTSLKQLTDFLRDFDLIKNFVLRSTAIGVADQLLVTADDRLTNSERTPAVFEEVGQDYGKYFTFARFWIFLLQIAVIGFNSIRSDNSKYSNVEKLFFMLAKMEMSKGFKRLYNGIPRNTAVQYSLIPPSYVLAKIIKNDPIPTGPQYIEERKIKVDKDYIKQLQRLFVQYCSINDNSKTNRMTLFKFISFLKDVGILNMVSPIKAELIFAKVVGSSGGKETDRKQSKMQFDSFYQALAIIAKRLFPELTINKALELLIESKTERLEETERNELGDVLDELNREEIRELIIWIQKTFKQYFDIYTNSKCKMEYETFLKFCRDFGIFPDLCNKPTLHTIFYHLCNLLYISRSTIY